MEEYKTGTITGFRATWGSGLATLEIDGRAYHSDNGPLVRALDNAFPGFITPGHSCDPAVIIGEEIAFDLDEFGLCIAWIAIPAELH